MVVWSQPLSTDISYRYGESKPGDQFPLITLCNYKKFFGNPILKECGDGSWDFISEVVSCMKSNKTFKEADFMQNLHLEIGNLVEVVRLWTGLKYVSCTLDEISTRVFLDDFGPCYMFDLTKVDKLKNVTIPDGKRPGLEIVMAENTPWQGPELILHARFDLPDAKRLFGFLPVSFSDKTKEVHRILLRKKIIKKESTRKAPCVKHEYTTCRNIENTVSIFEKFHCSTNTLLWSTSG